MAPSYYSERFDQPEMPVKVRGLKKFFGKTKALDGVDFEVGWGESVCVLGSNGSGKSTLIKAITGLARPTEGEVRVFGFQPFDNKKRIGSMMGYVPQYMNVFTEFSVKYNLELFCSMFGAPKERVDQLMEQFDLEQYAEEQVKSLSGGYRRRITMACSLVHDPQLLVFDEPESGLDPSAREKIWESIEKLKETGKSIILITHSITEATRLCNKVYFFHQGKVVAQGRPEDLLSRVSDDTIVDMKLHPYPKGVIVQEVKKLEGVGRVFTSGETMLVETTIDQAVDLVERLSPVIKETGYTAANVSIHDPTLEDVFLLVCGGRMGVV